MPCEQHRWADAEHTWVKCLDHGSFIPCSEENRHWRGILESGQAILPFEEELPAEGAESQSADEISGDQKQQEQAEPAQGFEDDLHTDEIAHANDADFNIGEVRAAYEDSHDVSGSDEAGSDELALDDPGGDLGEPKDTTDDVMPANSGGFFIPDNEGVSMENEEQLEGADNILADPMPGDDDRVDPEDTGYPVGPDPYDDSELRERVETLERLTAAFEQTLQPEETEEQVPPPPPLTDLLNDKIEALRKSQATSALEAHDFVLFAEYAAHAAEGDQASINVLQPLADAAELSVDDFVRQELAREGARRIRAFRLRATQIGFEKRIERADSFDELAEIREEIESLTL